MRRLDEEQIRQEVKIDFQKQFCQWTETEEEAEVQKRLKEIIENQKPV